MSRPIIAVIILLIFYLILILITFNIDKTAQMEMACESKEAVLVMTYKDGWQCVKLAE